MNSVGGNWWKGWYIWVRQVWNSFYLVYFDPHLKKTLKNSLDPTGTNNLDPPIYIWGISRCVKVTPPPAHPCNRKSLDPPTSSSGLVLTESMDWLRAMVASVFKLDVPASPSVSLFYSPQELEKKILRFISSLYIKFPIHTRCSINYCRKSTLNNNHKQDAISYVSTRCTISFPQINKKQRKKIFFLRLKFSMYIR